MFFVSQFAPAKIAAGVRYRQTLERLKRGNHYPEVQHNLLDREHTFNVPDTFNDKKTVTFRWTSPLAIAVALLNDRSLHDCSANNYIWEARPEYDPVTNERIYTNELSSGEWWPRNSERYLAEPGH